MEVKKCVHSSLWYMHKAVTTLFHHLYHRSADGLGLRLMDRYNARNNQSLVVPANIANYVVPVVHIRKLALLQDAGVKERSVPQTWHVDKPEAPEMVEPLDGCHDILGRNLRQMHQFNSRKLCRLPLLIQIISQG